MADGLSIRVADGGAILENKILNGLHCDTAWVGEADGRACAAVGCVPTGAMRLGRIRPMLNRRSVSSRHFPVWGGQLHGETAPIACCASSLLLPGIRFGVPRLAPVLGTFDNLSRVALNRLPTNREAASGSEVGMLKRAGKTKARLAARSRPAAPVGGSGGKVATRPFSP